MFILQTSKEDLKLAEEEIKALAKYEVVKYNNFFIADCDYERLALCNFAYKVIERFPKCKSFKFEEANIPKEEAFKYVDDLKEKGAKVNLSNPEKTFALVKFKKTTYLTELVYTNKKEFKKRNPKSRPEFHPGACIPQFAKVLVNLSGVKKNQTLLDPFCGTGGMLIEGSFMGINCYGSDISYEMLEKSNKNLKYFKIEPKLERKDAMEITKRTKVIVTELPFGTTTRIHGKGVAGLFSDFLNNILEKDLTKKVVVGLPNKVKISHKGWAKTFDHEVYIHKSLSKRILVLERG